MKKHSYSSIFCIGLILFLVLELNAGMGRKGKIEIVSLDKQEENSQQAAPQASKRPLPVYLSELSNLNDYNVFANSGWDGNWYVGFNVCWIESLPLVPGQDFKKAFIGAKLGRAKTRPVPGKPIWEKEPIPGEIYVSISSTPAWESSQKYFLTETNDIPLEGDPENAVDGVGEARWFWTEVPVNAVNAEGPNFIALWSPAKFLVSTASSPILAGGWGSQNVNSWLNNDIRGYAPLMSANSLKTPISVFEPAIAMKLIPQGTEQKIEVSIDEVKNGRFNTQNKTVISSVSGEEIEKVWLEVLSTTNEWQKHGRYIYCPPYQFTIKANQLPNSKIKVRCSANDIWGNTSASKEVEIDISR